MPSHAYDTSKRSIKDARVLSPSKNDVGPDNEAVDASGSAGSLAVAEGSDAGIEAAGESEAARSAVASDSDATAGVSVALVELAP